MKPNDSALVYNTHPVVSELNRVPRFDPLRFLKQTDHGPDIELKYKKLWFRLKYPTGRIKMTPLKITEQLAIIEARVFFDKNDTEPVSAFTAQSDKSNAPGGLYIEESQYKAVDQALTDAGFGLQFLPDNGSNTVAAPVATTPARPNTAPIKKEPAATPLVPKVPVQAPQPTPAPVAAPPVVEEVIQQPAAPAPAVEVPVETQPAQTIPVAPAPVCEAFSAAVPPASVVAPAPTQEAPAVQTGGYTNDMSVEEICARMTLEEAENYIVPLGTCNGQTMGQVADRRPASLRYYISGYAGDNNILRAAATVVSQSRLQKAS